MLKMRIIPCLDIKGGRTVKGVNFLNIRDAGDPVELAKKYVEEGADELVFLDITATNEERKTVLDLAQRVAKEINIPFTIGGGIGSLAAAAEVIEAGADKISINSAAVQRRGLIKEIASNYGSQFLVLAIDVKKRNGEWKVFVNGGTRETDLEAVSWAKQAEALGAGEILLTSMSSDGTRIGFDLEGINAVADAVTIPVIASGGAGNIRHFEDVFTKTKATGALAASIFHFGQVRIPELKETLKNKKIAVR